MKRLDYLKAALNQTKLFELKEWYISCFSILLASEPDISSLHKYDLVKKIKGIFAVVDGEDGKFDLEEIEGYTEGQPLFSFNETIEIDSSWIQNVSGKLTTKIGNLIINKLAIESVVGSRIPFLTGPLTTTEFEKLFIDRVRNMDEATADPLNTITVDEMIQIIDRLYFLTNIAEIISITATEKNITAPDNIDKLRADLIKEYEGQLNDPVKLVEFENKLREIDDEYLKDDPTRGIVLTGKSQKARKKMFLAFGRDKGFGEEGESKPIVSSLESGLELNDESYPEYMNSLRYGSYARGKLTALSGTQTKILLRSLGNLTIRDNDCGTQEGLKRFIDKKTYTKLINREVRVGNKWIPISSDAEAKEFTDKVVEIRSAMYCKSEKNSLCYHCTSKLFQNQENAIFHLSTEMSSIMMNIFLKLMHDASMTSQEMSISDLVT